VPGSMSRGPRALGAVLGAVAVDPRAASLALAFSGGLRREKSRVRGRKARLGEDLVMSKGPLGEVPRPPEPTPLDSPPQHAPSPPGVAGIPPGCLGGYLHCMRVRDPFAGPCVVRGEQGLKRG
jgi:hypothetical protein